jgi:hypothetical protein
MLAEIMDEDVTWNRSKAGSENLPNDVMDADIVVKTERKKGAGSSEGRCGLSAEEQKSMNQGIRPPTGEGRGRDSGRGLDFAVQAANVRQPNSRRARKILLSPRRQRKLPFFKRSKKAMELEKRWIRQPQRDVTL